MNPSTDAQIRSGRLQRIAERGRKAHGSFERLAALAARASGSSAMFMLACAAVVLWALAGPLFGYSESWQLAINTATTIVTFLMVFLIQHAQNKDSRAVHLKLNELLAANEFASNRLVAIEDLDEESLKKLHRFYCQLAELAENEGGLNVSHSPSEAEQLHSRKKHARQAHAGRHPVGGARPAHEAAAG